MKLPTPHPNQCGGHPLEYRYWNPPLREWCLEPSRRKRAGDVGQTPPSFHDDFARAFCSVRVTFGPMIALKDSLGTEVVERVRTIFSEAGRLPKSKNFEFRPQQQEIAAAVARALEEERHLVVEAGTGIDKSLP